MSWTKLNESTRTLIYSAVVVTLAAAGLLIGVQNNTAEANTSMASNNAVPAATFAANAGTLGAIPDFTGTTCHGSAAVNKDVTFTAAGLSGAPSAVNISMTFGSPNHSFVGDIVATLIAPNGASHTIFGRTSATTATAFGDSSDLGATYTFSDNAPAPPSGGWWQQATAAAATAIMAAGTYRTTANGGAGAVNPQPPTSINAAFTGVASPNGTWTLRLADGCGGDTGNVSAAVLDITTGPAAVNDANVDMNGDGKTDWVVARGTTTPLTEGTAPTELAVRRNFDSSAETKSRDINEKTDSAVVPPIYWYTNINGVGTTTVTQLGDAATDFITPEDFDGDGKDDLAVWTPGAPNTANFKILQSSNNTLRTEIFGQTGDDPAIVGDYDGDNKADPAVFRCPAFGAGDGQCFFFYRGSFNNPGGNITYVPWGFGEDGDFFPYVGDFDGDSKNDFCIQRANPSSPTNGQFVLLKSQGLGVEYINWGLSSDFLIPGDYDGDGRTDLCVRRTVSGLRQHYILERDGGTSQIQWGITGDQSAPGDYDGDGKQDLAVWRPNADPTQNYFFVLNSSNFSVTNFEWGQNGDLAVAGWAVH